MLDEKDDATDNEPIEEANNMQPGDVVVDRLGFGDAESALVTLKQKPTNVIPFIHSVQTLQNEIDIDMHKNLIKLLRFVLLLRLDV
jgi:hypothetical protein